jgi:hypothetical protein
MNVSVICACKNRYNALRVSLNSWLAFDEIKEIIIVDWSSDEPINHLTKLDKRIKIIRVDNEKYFNQPQPLNLAASIATGDYILKVDCDYIINPYFPFFECYKIDSNSFLCGQDDYVCEHEYWNENLQGYAVNFHNMDVGELMKYSHTYSPFFKYLTGLCFVTRENYWKVGGYDERMGKYYAFEDDQMTKRLSMMGLECKKLQHNFNIMHIPHPDKKRYENFEGYGENSSDNNIENVKRKIADPNTSDSDRWNLEYLLAKMNVEENEKLFSDLDHYYIERIYQWNLVNIDGQNYFASRKEKVQKLSELKTVYYVSLEESVDRQLNLQKQFLEHGVTNINPIISKRFSESNDIVTGKYLHQLNDGTKGCCVSHLKAIKEWYDTNEEDYGFFCEDDLSLDTVNYWNFTWGEFIDNLPKDWECIQMLCIRGEFNDIKLRGRCWDDWAATAYILKRDYAKYLIDNYIVDGTYHLELKDAEVMPLIENILFAASGKVYTIPLFVEDISFTSTFDGDDGDVKGGQKRNHYYTHDYVINWWKDNGQNKKIEELLQMKRSFKISKDEKSFHPKGFGNSSKEENPNELEISLKEKYQESNILVDVSNSSLDQLLLDYALDTENPVKNFNLGMWYEYHRHNAPALSYFLRCAERTEDDLFAYEALIHASNSYDRQGTRDTTAKGLLQQALCVMPRRPEAYYLLARFSAKRQCWQDSYIFCQWAIEFCDFDCTPLHTDVEYPGKYGLLFEKQQSAWWWGKGAETKSLLQDIKNNYKLDKVHYEEVQNKLIQFGLGFVSEVPEEIINYQKCNHNKLRFKFHGSEEIEKNFSQEFQDMFILAATRGKMNGLYLEIGAHQPFYQSNTALLETKYDWDGISVEIIPDLCAQFSKERKNQIICQDATTIDYENLLDKFDKGTDFDYLQLDVESSKTTFECLLAIPLDKYRFAIITYDHNHYLDMSSSYRDKSRRYLNMMGYEMLVANVSPNDNSPFEDWWYHPDLIDPEIVKEMKSVSDETVNIVKYMFRD